MIEKIECVHCENPIEFETDEFEAGQVIACPHCGKRIIPKTASKKLDSGKAELAPQRKIEPSRIASVFVCIVGACLIGCGVMNDLSAQNIMQQIYSAIEFCCGWIVFAIGVAVDVLVSIGKNQGRD